MGAGTGEAFHVCAAGHRLRAQWIMPHAGAAGPCLVFLHEGLGSIGQWRGFPADLCRAAGLPGLVYERWGFGGSEGLDLPRARNFLALEAERALPELLAACGIERPILIGHSDGATIALLYAAAFPERPAALVSEAAHVFLEEVTLQGIRDAIARWRVGDLRARLARYHGANTETMFRGWAETWLDPGLRDWSMVDRLPAITCPALVIQGAGDAHGTAAQVEAIARGVSGPVETWIVPGCGHVPHLEARAAVLEKIAAFVEGLPA